MSPLRFFKSLAALLALACAAGASTGAQSTPPPEEEINAPPALHAWRDWALYRQEFRQCPLIVGAAGVGEDDFLCAWPGLLTLETTERGAVFSQRWQVAAPSWVALPGDRRYWPQEVTVNGTPQPVLEHNDAPSLWLPAGDHEVRGRMAWPERPQALAVPPVSGLIALSVDGKPIQPLQRDGDQLTLGRSATASEEADSLELQVYRKLTDGIPAQLTTRLQLQVSGKAREIQIAPALPAHFVATALNTPWPARLDAEGRLQVQVQPGQATLELSARADAPQAAWPARLPDAIKQEVWSWQAAPALRVTAVTTGGEALAVDPRQAGVPPEWQALPAFAMSAGSQLNIEERSRGLAAGETNRLTLSRALWLDFDGDGWFAKDAIRGQMRHGWRLDVAAPYRLQRANDAGEPLLVTQGVGNNNTGNGNASDPALTGVEWRSPQVALDASVRIATGPAAALPVAGWRQTFDQVDATLHLPWGYKLLAAPGADASNDSWLARWTVLDIFLAAFIALLAWRLLGVAGGVAAAAYLLLALQERGAPLWTLGVALALALLARALPGGKLGAVLRWTQYAALAVFCLTAIAFAPGQLRAALYPQLERADNRYAVVMKGEEQMMRSLAQEQPMMAEPAPPPVPTGIPPEQGSNQMTRRQLAENARLAELQRNSSEARMLADKAASAAASAPMTPDQLVVSGSVSTTRAKVRQQQRYAQSNVVQTGGGEPDWDIGQSYFLRWSGPIMADQTVRLVIIPPWLTRLLRVAMIALLGWLAWRVVRRPAPGGPRRTAAAPVAPAAPVAAALALALALVAALHPAPALAQDNAAAFPPDKLLQDLRDRLNPPPRCAPDCASIARADIRIEGSALALRLHAHAGSRVALPLPRAQDNTTLLRARIDGQPASGVLRDEDGDTVVDLPRGVHLVELDYAVAGGDTALHFGLPPMRINFAGAGWQADGIDEERLINQTVHLARTASADSKGDAPDKFRDSMKDGGVQQFPPYVRVTRTLRFDLDWSARASVARLSPREGGLTLALPLLAGEHVTTPGVKVQGSEATVSLGQNEPATGWQSRLDKADTLRLTAPALAERAEVWRIEVGPMWNVRWDGVPVTLSSNGDETVFEFHPLPGETLTLTPTAPSAAEGGMKAIDRVGVTHDISPRASQHTLAFTLRASQGGEHIITLPAGMEVLSVTRERDSLNLRPQDGKLTLPVAPGAQRYTITLRELREAGATRLALPVFDLGLPAANIDISANLPGQRWLLAAFGPSAGPAVLYWGELAVALVLAALLTLALTRRGWTTLRPHHWLLLVLGFSTFSWAALTLIVVWLIALDWRGRAALSGWRAAPFNAMQIGLALLTFAALCALIAAIPVGLLGQPDMGVTGQGSHGNQLRWFADQSAGGNLPAVTLITLPLWAYRAAMLAWALWLAWSVIGWLRRGLSAWLQGGYWRRMRRAATPPAPAPAQS